MHASLCKRSIKLLTFQPSFFATLSHVYRQLSSKCLTNTFLLYFLSYFISQAGAGGPVSSARETIGLVQQLIVIQPCTIHYLAMMFYSQFQQFLYTNN